MRELSPIPAPDVLQATLGYLMARYKKLPSAKMAETVVQVMEVLLAHPGFDASLDERSTYKYILKQWRAKSLLVIDDGTKLGHYH